MADRALARELMSGKKRHSLPIRQKTDSYLVYVITSVFGDKGHAGRMMQEIMNTLGESIPSPEGPASIVPWMTDCPAWIDIIGNLCLNARIGRSYVGDDGLNAVLGHKIASKVKTILPDHYGDEFAAIHQVVHDMGMLSIPAQKRLNSIIDGSTDAKSVTKAEELLKEEIKRAYEKYFSQERLPLPVGWHYAISSLLRIMYYWDQEFFSRGYMKLIGVSAANLVYEYARRHNVDLNKMLGIYGAKVQGVSKYEATLTFVLEAHTVKIGGKIFLVRARKIIGENGIESSQLEVNLAQEVQWDTGEPFEFTGPEYSRPIGATLIQKVETWCVNSDGTLEGIVTGKKVSFQPRGNDFLFELDGMPYDGEDAERRPITGGLISNVARYLVRIGREEQSGLDVYLRITNLGKGSLEIETLKGSSREGLVPLIALHGKQRRYNSNDRTIRCGLGIGAEFKAIGEDVHINAQGIHIVISEKPGEEGKTALSGTYLGGNLEVLDTDALWNHILAEKSIFIKSRLVEGQTFTSDAGDMLPALVEKVIFKEAERGEDGKKWAYEPYGSRRRSFDRAGKYIRILRPMNPKDKGYPKATPEVIQKIRKAKVILLGLGGHFDSMLPCLMVDGIIDAIKAAKDNKAHIIFIPNPTMDVQTAQMSLMDQIRVIEKSVNILCRPNPFHFTDILTHIYYVDCDHIPNKIPNKSSELAQRQREAWEKICIPKTQEKLKIGQEDLSEIVALGFTKIGFIQDPRDPRGDCIRGISYLERELGQENVIEVFEKDLEVMGGRIVYRSDFLKNVINTHLANAGLP